MHPACCKGTALRCARKAPVRAIREPFLPRPHPPFSQEHTLSVTISLSLDFGSVSFCPALASATAPLRLCRSAHPKGPSLLSHHLAPSVTTSSHLLDQLSTRLMHRWHRTSCLVSTHPLPEWPRADHVTRPGRPRIIAGQCDWRI